MTPCKLLVFPFTWGCDTRTPRRRVTWQAQHCSNTWVRGHAPHRTSPRAGGRYPGPDTMCHSNRAQIRTVYVRSWHSFVVRSMAVPGTRDAGLRNYLRYKIFFASCTVLCIPSTATTRSESSTGLRPYFVSQVYRPCSPNGNICML
jgi:hypothetical protein